MEWLVEKLKNAMNKGEKLEMGGIIRYSANLREERKRRRYKQAKTKRSSRFAKETPTMGEAAKKNKSHNSNCIG
jgi:hypothetical protein